MIFAYKFYKSQPFVKLQILYENPRSLVILVFFFQKAAELRAYTRRSIVI